MINHAKDRIITILLHVLGWSLLIVVLFMYPPLAGAATQLPDAFWVKQTIHIAVLIFAFYFNARYLIPSLFFKGKLYLYIACLAACCFVASFILARVDVWLDLSRQLERAFGKKMWPKLHIDFFALITTILILGISTTVTVMQRWSRDSKARQQLESQQTIAELSFLKAQINPHFFFNTLNSIYALTYIDVETSRQSLYKLSHMMRYLLYETQQNTTLLSREIEFIKDYVEIMKLRLRDNTIVLLNMPDTIAEMPIAPMLLLPFIENAFKHGVDDQETSYIHISITQAVSGLEMSLVNNIYRQPEPVAEQSEEKGIGLVNTKRRLDLLYPNNYSLNVTETVAQYSVQLKLTLI